MAKISNDDQSYNNPKEHITATNPIESDEGMAERKKVADVTKTIASVSPDKSTVMFKIVVHDMAALHSFMDGSNPVSKPVFDEVMDGYEIYELTVV